MQINFRMLKTCRMKITIVDAKGARDSANAKKGETVGEFARKKGFSPSAFLFCRNNELCLESETLREGDEIKLVRVISGG